MIAFVFSLFAPAAAANAYPSQKVLTEFKQICVEPLSYASTQAAARASGWQFFVPSPPSAMGKVVGAGQKLMATTNKKLAMPAYWKQIGGRRVELVLTSMRVPFEGRLRALTGCNMYDFSASTPISADVLTAWAGRAATAQKIEQGFLMTEWTPGLASLPSQTRIAHIADSTLNKARMPFTGLSLVSNVFEKAE